MMQINLWDSNFAQSACSVAWATPEHVEYVRERYRWPGVTLFTDSWIFNPVVDEVESPIKIAWLHEPGCLWPTSYSQIFDRIGHPLDRPRWFNTVLTYRRDFLEAFPSEFGFCPYGGIWIARDAWGMRPKTKLVSMLYGEKRTTRGHQLRHEIGSAFSYSQVDYFGLKGEVVDYSQATKLRVHGDYMYSIVVETCREDWLFTEILLDCFAVGTIPIFWGCPDIGRFFDTRGILRFETLDELRDIMALIEQDGENLYKAMRPYAWRNLGLVKEFAITEDWMYKNILKERFG